MSLYNLRNPAVKRLMKEAEELKTPTEEYYAQPLEDNLFEWHFTLRGPPNTEFEGGIYHGRITLPHDYPMKPPSIILLTPNGRFEINKKICLSISGHHPESWQPSWSIRTALLAIIGFLPTHGNGAIGSLDYTPEERKNLALKSQDWKCPDCGYIKGCLKIPGTDCSETNGAQRTETVPLSPDDGSTSAKEVDTPHNEDAHSEKMPDIDNVKTNSVEHSKITSSVIPELEITANESAPVLRQRNVVSRRLLVESVQSENVTSVQPEDGTFVQSENGAFVQSEDESFVQSEHVSFVQSEDGASVQSEDGASVQSEDGASVQSEDGASVQSKKETVKPTEVKSAHNYCSLVMIWIISAILFILIVRRWLYSDNSL